MSPCAAASLAAGAAAAARHVGNVRPVTIKNLRSSADMQSYFVENQKAVKLLVEAIYIRGNPARYCELRLDIMLVAQALPLAARHCVTAGVGAHVFDAVGN